MAYFPSSSSSGGYYGKGRRGRNILAELAESSNQGNEDALKELMRTMDTKETGSGITGFLGDLASDVWDVASRGLDLLSRGNYASAEFANRFISMLEGEGETPQGAPADDPLDLLSGLLGGLSGRNKTTYSDVITGMDEGAKNIIFPWSNLPGGTALTGFALDVLADPTTYVGAGLIGKVGKAGKYVDDVSQVGGSVSKALGKAAEGSEEALRKGIFDEIDSPINQVRRGQELSREVIDEAGGIHKFVNLSRAQKEKLRRTVRRRLRDRDFEAAERIMKLERDTYKPQLGLKIGIPGSKRHIAVPIPGARAGADAIGSRLGNVPFVRSLSRVLRTDSAYGTGYQQLGRISEARNSAQFEVATRLFRSEMNNLISEKGLGKLSQADQRIIAQAIDTGLSTGDQGLDEVAEYMRGWFKRMGDIESKAGLIKADEVIDDYFPHYYRKDPGSSTRRKVRALRRSRIGRPAPPGRKVQDAFEYARKVGADVITDLDEVMTRRLGQHFESMARYEFLDELAQKFGVRVGVTTSPTGKRTVAGTVNKERRVHLRSKGYRRLSDIWSMETGDMHRYVGNIQDSAEVWVPPETVDALKSLRSISLSDTDAAYFGKLHRQVLSAVKSSLTIWNPAFHIRNFRGDIQLNFLDGVKDPRLYGTAARVLEADTHRALDQVGGLLGSSEKLKNMRIKINNNLTISGEEFMSLFRNAGAKSGFISYELPTRVTRNPIRKLSGKIRGASEFREDIPRAAHFLHVLKENKGARSIDELLDTADEAGARVRKFNIDYGDLTEAEKKLKNIFPFYTWFRKNVPLQLEMMFTRPGVQSLYAKAYNLTDELYGEDDDTIIPKWMSELSPVQVRRNGMNKFLAGVLAPLVPGAGANLIPGTDPVFISGGSIPLMDALGNVEPLVRAASGDFEGGARSAAKILTDQLSPLITTPLEIGTGRNFFTGAPSDSSVESLAGLFPLTRLAGLGTGQGGLIPGTLAGDPKTTQQLLNFLGATDLQVVTPERQVSELRRREDILDSLIRAKRDRMGEDDYELYKENNLRNAEPLRALERLLGRG